MATIKPLYNSAASIVGAALNSLASDTNLLAGWSSAVQDNTANLSIDELITGFIKAGSTAPTAGTTIEIWAWGVLDDTPTYPDQITGSQAAITLTSRNVIYGGAFRLGTAITVDATANRIYPFAFSLASLFGGLCPRKWGIWIVQNTAQALASSGHAVNHCPVQLQAA